jgi:hypothetical protein
MKKNLVKILMSAAAIGLVSHALAATTEATATYNAANNLAGTDYKVTRAKCDSLAGNPKDLCIAQAKYARITVEANAKAEYKDTLGARTKATKLIADAKYDVEKTKCDSQAGNDKDVCIKKAKANKVTVVANATADKKIIEALTDASEDRNTANYKIELEKCDSFSGVAKDTCVTNAKNNFGK